MKNLLSDNELNSLKLFNNICTGLRGDYSNTADGLIRIWYNTLNILSAKFTKSVLNSLLSGLLKRTPHWKDEIDKKQSTIDKLYFYFVKCAVSLDRVSVGNYDNRSNFQSYVSRSYSTTNGFCLVHPNKKIAKNSVLCNNCMSKRKRLKLEKYPLDYGLLYVLKIRKQYSIGIKYCVNHSNHLALGNGLCSYCNLSLGELEEELSKIDFTYDKLKNVFMS